MPTSLPRRRFLQAAGVAGLVVATGCWAGQPARQVARQDPLAPAPPTATPRPTSAPAAGAPRPVLAPARRWVPSPSEPVPGIKQAAADAVQRLCTRAPGEGLDDALAALAPHLDDRFDPAAALRVLAPLDVGTTCAGDVVYPQLAGLAPLGTGAISGAVMVVVRQRFSDGGATGEVVRTVDVRLARDGGRWRVTSVADAGGEPVDRPAALGPAARRVLDSPRLLLPDSARWDVHAGRVSSALLDLLASSSERGPVGVTTFRAGHPVHVFGTRRTSDHAVGRAVDLWQVGGVPVVDARGRRSAAARLQAAALRDPRTAQVGSPQGTDADGRRRRSFTDLVHADHLHLAVRRSG